MLMQSWTELYAYNVKGQDKTKFGVGRAICRKTEKVGGAILAMGDSSAYGFSFYIVYTNVYIHVWGTLTFP